MYMGREARSLEQATDVAEHPGFGASSRERVKGVNVHYRPRLSPFSVRQLFDSVCQPFAIRFPTVTVAVLTVRAWWATAWHSTCTASFVIQKDEYMNRIVLIATLTAIGIVPIASGQEQKAEKSEQPSKAGDLPRGKPGPGTVWVDASTKTYYRQGDRLYGKTNKGAYMSEGDAVNSGYHDSTEKPAKK